MNPENQSEIVVPKESIITPLCRVTPVSKVLAAIIFIILPFLGAYVGYVLAPEKVVGVVVNEQVTNKQIPTDTLVKNLLPNVPTDAQHILFDERKTGYFISGGNVYLAQTANTVDTPNGDWDWVIVGPAKLIPEADVVTFKVVSAELAQTGSLYAVDSMGVYFFDKLLPNVDIQTLEIIGKGGAFLISDKGLYAGENFITSGAKQEIELYVINRSEGMSPFHLYVHNLVNDEWLEGGFGLETKIIPAPKISDLKTDLKLYPRTKNL